MTPRADQRFMSLMARKYPFKNAFHLAHERGQTARNYQVALSVLVAAAACVLTSAAVAAPPIGLGHRWGRLADPAGTVNATTRNGIVSGESAEFSKDGLFIVTTSKADGRTTLYSGSHLTGATAHLRFWDIAGNLLWDKARSRGPIDPSTGRPSDQPASGTDELEVATFSRDDLYVAAAGEDRKIEVWLVRDLVSRQILAEPILVKTFIAGGGVDSLMYSHNGDLLFAGTEEAGKVEVFRVQGDPVTWQFVHKANHGGSGTNGVNSVALTEDDAYVASAGTNQTGGLWRLDVTRDGGGLVTAVNMVRLASMTEPTSTTREVRFLPGVDNSAGARKELVALTAEHDQATRIYSLQELLDHGVSTSGPPPIQTLRNFNTSITAGNPVEPLAWTGDGRFLLTPGKTRDAVMPAFLRIYESAEVVEGAPEPDPVFVQTDNVRNPEYFDFNSDSTRLTSSHHDGSVRLWDVTISGSETIASEAFNETTSAAARWTLSGASLSGFGSIGDVVHAKPFRGHRGSRYIAIDQLNSTMHKLTLNGTWNVGGHTNRQVQFAAAAATGEFESDDFLRLYADTNGDGTFETLIAEFLADANKNLKRTGTTQTLNLTFSDVFIDLEPLLPANSNQSVRFQLQSSTSSTNEEIAFDSLRVTGEPSTAEGAFDGFESNSYSGGTGWADPAWTISANGGSHTPDLRQADNGAIMPFEGSHMGRVRHRGLISRGVGLGETGGNVTFAWAKLGLTGATEKIVFEINRGSGWYEQATLNGGSADYAWITQSIALSGPAGPVDIRFRIVGDSISDIGYIDDVAITPNPASAGIYIEAEGFVNASNFSPFVVGSDVTASSGRYIAVPNGAGSLWSASGSAKGQAQYNFSTSTTATVDLWARVNFPNANDDSFFYKLDSGAWGTQNSATTTGWAWRKIASFPGVPGGNHTITILRREDGSKIDRLFVSTNGSSPAITSDLLGPVAP